MSQLGWDISNSGTISLTHSSPPRKYQSPTQTRSSTKPIFPGTFIDFIKLTRRLIFPGPWAFIARVSSSYCNFGKCDKLRRCATIYTDIYYIAHYVVGNRRKWSARLRRKEPYTFRINFPVRPRRRTVQIYNVRQIKHQGQELYKTNPDGKCMCAMKCITRYTRESGWARNHTLMQSIKYYYSTFGGLDASDRPRDYGTNVLDAMYSKLDWCVGDGWKMSVCVCVRYRV